MNPATTMTELRRRGAVLKVEAAHVGVIQFSTVYASGARGPCR